MTKYSTHEKLTIEWKEHANAWANYTLLLQFIKQRHIELMYFKVC